MPGIEEARGLTKGETERAVGQNLLKPKHAVLVIELPASVTTCGGLEQASRIIMVQGAHR